MAHPSPLDVAVTAEINVLKIEPGDLIVLETSQALSPDQAAEIKRRFRERTPELADHDVMVLAGVQLKVVRV